MKFKSGFLFLSIVLLFCGPAHAQMPTGQWYVIHSEIVKPSMVKEYEAATKEFIELVKANQATMPHFQFAGLQGADFTYSYVLPIANMAAMDSINADFKAMMTGPSAAKFMEIMTRGNANIEYVREFVVGEAPELSYTPANPRLKPEEQMFFRLEIYYVKADKGMEAEALCKEFVELFKKKNIADGYKIFLPVMSSEMPAVIVRIAAKDEADFYAASAKNRQLLGEEGKALFGRAFSLTRRFETRSSWMRSDLSLMPAPAEKK
jgi:hypothetical protein